jgi:hypothetical protein
MINFVISANTLIETSTYLPTYFADMPPYFYEYKGDFHPTNRMLEIDISVQFLGTNQEWTKSLPLKGIVDTGASYSHISQSVVPSEILELNKGNKSSGYGAGGSFENIVLYNNNFIFTESDSKHPPFVFFLPTISAMDDHEIKQKRLKENIPYYPLIIGQDVLEKAELLYDGIGKNYTLKFKI